VRLDRFTLDRMIKILGKLDEQVEITLEIHPRRVCASCAAVDVMTAIRQSAACSSNGLKRRARPQMANWLPEEEREQLRADFRAELERLGLTA
jgi:hypothetical protein